MNKSHLFLFSLLVIFIFLLFIFSKKTHIDDVISLKEKSITHSVTHEIEVANSKKIDSTYLEKAATSISNENYEISFQDAIKMVEWQQDHGYPAYEMSGEIYKSDYDIYNLSELKELAESGDRIAMQKLGVRLLKNGKFDIAEKYLWDASVRGYTKSIAETFNMLLLKRQKELDAELKKEYAIKAFSLMEVSLRRGDLMTRFSISMNSHIKFNATDRKRIKALSLEYYEKLSIERKNLGYPEFDNSYPKALDKWTSRFINN